MSKAWSLEGQEAEISQLGSLCDGVPIKTWTQGSGKLPWLAILCTYYPTSIPGT